MHVNTKLNLGKGIFFLLLQIQAVSKVCGHFSIQINDSFRIPMLIKVFQFYVHCFL